jgi:hypothetical protein
MARGSPRLFAKHFQGSAVPMPSFSKEKLGGFVGFQGLTIDPNANTRFYSAPNFCGSLCPKFPWTRAWKLRLDLPLE